MWVSWKRQQTGAWPRRYVWRATVSETKRVEGKPRVTVVGDLGSVTEGKEGRAANRFAFWTRAERRLARFGIPSADRDRFRATLAERVEPFDDAGIFADPAEWLALYDIDPALGVAIFWRLAPTLAPDDVADRRAVLGFAKVRLALQEAEAAQIRARRRIVGRSTAAAASEN